ncbi:MAG: alpha-galactosidase [Deltaproteobacteria bacterium]|nr:alpha-galactosidase [Deltaproteobacteria bacterium]
MIVGRFPNLGAVGIVALLGAFVCALAACEKESDFKEPWGLPAEPQRICPTTFTSGDDGTWSLVSDSCGSGIGAARVRVGYEYDGVAYFTGSDQYPEFNETENVDGGVTWSLAGHETAPDLEVTFTHEGERGALTVAVALRASDHAARVTSVEPMRLDGANGVRLPGLAGGLHFLHNGYDSWAYTAVERLSAADGDPRREGSLAVPAANDREWWDVRKGVGWWMAAGRVPTSNLGFVMGVLSAKVLKTYFVADVPDSTDDRVAFDVVMGTPGDILLIPAGTTRDLDPLYLQLTGDMPAALDDYGRAAAVVTPPLEWAGERPRGWATWYDLFTDVTPQDVLDHVDFLSQPEYQALGYNVVQIDDGYEQSFGDWDENEKFASIGMDGLAEAIRDAGLVAGIWIAPIVVNTQSELVADHPMWFLRDEHGELLLFSDPFIGEHAILDVTHPDAAEHLRSVIRRFTDAGYTYLKLDFLFPAAYEAVRSDPSVTSLEAYALACDIMRHAAGDDVFLLASGEPLLPSAGKFHAARTSDDIVLSTFDTTSYRMSGVIARYNSARFWTEHLFSPDADNLCVRPGMSVDEAFATAVSNLLGGQNLFLGDDLRALDPEREAMVLDGDLIGLADEPGPTLPLDLFDEAMDAPSYFLPQDWVVRNSRTPAVWVRGDVMAVVNFSSASLARRVLATDLGFDTADRVRLTNLETGETIEDQNAVGVSVPGRRAMLFRFERAP